jgi:hypothetical protein
MFPELSIAAAASATTTATTAATVASAVAPAITRAARTAITRRVRGGPVFEQARPRGKTDDGRRSE